MSVKYAATSDQKSLMSFVNGKKKFWNVLDHPGNQKMFHFGLQASSRSARLFALQSHCGETALGEKKQKKKQRGDKSALESLLINSSHALLRDWVVHGARVL